VQLAAAELSKQLVHECKGTIFQQWMELMLDGWGKN